MTLSIVQMFSISKASFILFNNASGIDLGLSAVAHSSTVNLLYSTLFICYYNLYVTGIHVAFKGINKQLT